VTLKLNNGSSHVWWVGTGFERIPWVVSWGCESGRPPGVSITGVDHSDPRDLGRPRTTPCCSTLSHTGRYHGTRLRPAAWLHIHRWRRTLKPCDRWGPSSTGRHVDIFDRRWYRSRRRRATHSHHTPTHRTGCQQQTHAMTTHIN